MVQACWWRPVGGDPLMNIVTELQEILHHNHAYVSIFKYAFGNIYMQDRNETI